MGLKDKLGELLDKTEIDDKIVGGVKAGAGKVKGAVDGVLDKTDIDEKIAGKAKALKDKITGKQE